MGSAAHGAAGLARRAELEGRVEKACERAPVTPLFSVSVDAVADSALRAQQTGSGADKLRCDLCDEAIEGEPEGRGLYVWTRGDELRFEEPWLCACCATAVAVTALNLWSAEEEEG